jgi:hypothetical protein
MSIKVTPYEEWNDGHDAAYEPHFRLLGIELAFNHTTVTIHDVPPTNCQWVLANRDGSSFTEVHKGRPTFESVLEFHVSNPHILSIIPDGPGSIWARSDRVEVLGENHYHFEFGWRTK